jgi:multidrug resistance efflux pump
MEDIDNDIVRSEVSIDFLEQVPTWTVKWGIIAISIIMVAIVLLTLVIHYPTIVTAEFSLNTVNAPKAIVIKVDGRIEKLFIKENQFIKENFILAYIESSANHNQILDLEKKIQKLNNVDDYNFFKDIIFDNYNNLGDIQSQFQTFHQNYSQLLLSLKGQYYVKRKQTLLFDIKEIGKINQSLNEQYDLHSNDLELAKKEFKVHERLYSQKVIPSLDFYKEESKLLNKQIPLKNIQNSIHTNNSLINSKQREMLELDNSIQLQKEALLQSINSLKAGISTWKSRYLLTAPTDGRIYLSGLLQEKQFFKSGSEVLYINSIQNKITGEIRIPQNNFGKVKIGQKVLIKFQGYPYGEYGAIEGFISSIAQLPSINNGTFRAIVNLPNGLISNSNKRLNYKIGMLASAEIITEDLTIFERLFYNIRSLN